MLENNAQLLVGDQCEINFEKLFDLWRQITVENSVALFALLLYPTPLRAFVTTTVCCPALAALGQKNHPQKTCMNRREAEAHLLPAGSQL